MKALFDALNVAYEEKEKRSFIRLTLLTLGFTLGGIVFMIIAMTGIVLLPAVLNSIGLGDTATLLLKLARERGRCRRSTRADSSDWKKWQPRFSLFATRSAPGGAAWRPRHMRRAAESLCLDSIVRMDRTRAATRS